MTEGPVSSFCLNKKQGACSILGDHENEQERLKCRILYFPTSITTIIFFNVHFSMIAYIRQVFFYCYSSWLLVISMEFSLLKRVFTALSHAFPVFFCKFCPLEIDLYLWRICNGCLVPVDSKDPWGTQ